MNIKDTKLYKDIKGFGFLNGRIRFGDFYYNIELISVRNFKKYLEMITDDKADDKAYLESLQFICKTCLYRIEEKPIYKVTKCQSILNKIGFKFKGKIKEYENIKIYDFDILEYPHIICEKFTTDLFKVLIDRDFINLLLEEAEKED